MTWIFSAVTHAIDTKDVRHVNHRMRRTPLALEGGGGGAHLKLLDAGIISGGVQSGRPQLVQKRDGTVRYLSEKG